jgi:hypothetical protein
MRGSWPRKTTDTLVGTDPFFSAMPTEHGNPELAKAGRVVRPGRDFPDQREEAVEEAQKTALIRNEAVVKLSWVSDADAFPRPDRGSVGPFRLSRRRRQLLFGGRRSDYDAKGDYIYPDDDTFEDPNVEGLLHLEKEPG